LCLARAKFKTDGANKINCIGALGLAVGKIKRKNTRKMKEMKKRERNQQKRKESNERELIVNKGKKMKEMD
jgi:methylthioribose-1-phosphate isomerase